MESRCHRDREPGIAGRAAPRKGGAQLREPGIAGRAACGGGGAQLREPGIAGRAVPPKGGAQLREPGIAGRAAPPKGGAQLIEQARALSVAPSPAFWVAVAMYAIASVLLFVVLAGKSNLRPIAVMFVLFAWLAHGTDIGWRGTQGVHPAESVREALGFLAFIITGGYLLASTRYRLTLGGVVVMPVSLILLVLGRLTPAGDKTEDLSTLGRIHISLATLGVGVFALASALSAIYLVEDRALKRKKFEGAAFKDRGAPLESLDRLAHRLVWVGFPIFTIALVLGAVWTARLGQSPARIENLLAVVTWFAFATLLVARQIYGWRGRRAAKLALTGFAAAVAVLVIYLVRRIVE